MDKNESHLKNYDVKQILLNSKKRSMNETGIY